MKHNLLIVIGGLGVGGAEKVMISLVNRLDPKRFRTTVIVRTEDNPLAAEIHSGAARLITMKHHTLYNLSPAKIIRSAIQESCAETVLCFGLTDFFFTRLAVLGLPNPPQICISIHAIPRTMFDRKQRLMQWLYARLLNGEERIISVCNFQADHLGKSLSHPTPTLHHDLQRRGC